MVAPVVRIIKQNMRDSTINSFSTFVLKEQQSKKSEFSIELVAFTRMCAVVSAKLYTWSLFNTKL